MGAQDTPAVFTSSGVIYGQQPPDLKQIPEDYAGAPSTMDLESPYAQAKRISEWMCAMYAAQYGFDALIARLFSFVGPYLPLDSNFAIGNFIRVAMQGGPIRTTGDGTLYRSYLYAADLAIWLWTISIKGQSCRPYNVGSEEEISLGELAKTVAANIRPRTAIEITRNPFRELSKHGTSHPLNEPGGNWGYGLWWVLRKACAVRIHGILPRLLSRLWCKCLHERASSPNM